MTVATDLATAHGIKRRLRLRVEGVEPDLWQDDGTGLPVPRRHPTGDDCIALWRFDEALATADAVDATGHGHTGAQTGSPTVETGKFSGARGFAQSKYFTVADAAALRVQQFTIAAWVNYDGTVGYWPKLFFYDATGKYGAIIFGMDNNNAKMTCWLFFDDAAIVAAQDPSNLTAGQHHVATTYDGAVLKVYVDGAVVAVTAAVGTIEYNGDNLYIGNDPDASPPNQWWRGWIDDLAFYSTAKSPEWIHHVCMNGRHDRDGIGCLLPPDEITSEFDLGEMKCGLSAMTFELLDVKDSAGLSVLSPIFGAPARWDNNPHYRVAAGSTYLQQIEANATNIPVQWTDAAAQPGTIYVGRERIAYGNVVTSNVFTECNRGMYPPVGDQLGKVIRQPQEDDGESIPSVGTVPFSRIGARIALDVVTYDNRSQTWNDPAAALLLWAGKLSHSVRYVPDKNVWQLTCVSITEELNRKICENMPAAEPGSDDETVGIPGTADGWSLINLLGLSADERSLTVTEESATYNNAMGGHFVTVPEGVYTHAMLQVELRDPANWTSFGFPEVGFQFEVGVSGTRIRCWAYSITTWDARSVWVTSGRSGVDWQNKTTPNLSHLTNALGFGMVGRWSGVVQESPTWPVVGQRFGNVDAPKAPCQWYQPATSLYMALMLNRSDRFVTQQETGHGAFVTCEALRDRDGEKLGWYVANYTAKSAELASVTVKGALVYSMTYDRWTLAPIPGVSYLSDQWVGWRFGEDPVQLKQALVPIYQRTATSVRGPYEMLLNMLTSTGTPGLNGSYDILPHGWGLAIEATLVDDASFITADSQIMQSDLAHRKCYVHVDPFSWSDDHSREAKLFGWAVVWSNGKLTCKSMLTPAVDAWTVTLSDSTRATRREKPILDIPATTVVNRYAIQTQDHRTRKNLPLITITDADSKEGIGETRAIEIEHPGLPTERDPEALAALLKALLVGGRGSMLRYPCPVVDVSLAPSLVRRINVGDVARYSSAFTPDVQGSGAMGCTEFALATRVGWRYPTWTGSAQLVLLTTTRGYGGPYAPSALVNWGHPSNGWNATSGKLYLSPLHFGQAGDEDDGARFLTGQYVVLVDRCPAAVNAAAEKLFSVATGYDDSDKSLVLADGPESWYDDTREWVVEACNWGTAGAAQRLVGTWHANSTTARFGDGNSAQRWGK